MNADAWQRLHIGMTETEVVSIIGQPVRRVVEASNTVSLVYGVIVPRSQAFPSEISYRVWINTQHNTVTALETPFGQAPRNGAPSVPRIFLPQPDITFGHYPRILDIRWYPVTGTYPIHYEVEYESENGHSGTWFAVRTMTATVPYLAMEHEGSNSGRLRIRAINKLGTSEWSDYLVFRFTR